MNPWFPTCYDPAETPLHEDSPIFGTRHGDDGQFTPTLRDDGQFTPTLRDDSPSLTATEHDSDAEVIAKRMRIECDETLIDLCDYHIVDSYSPEATGSWGSFVQCIDETSSILSATVLEGSSTVLDPEIHGATLVDDQFVPAGDGDSSDSLCGWNHPPSSPLVETPWTESEFDSQLTVNDNPAEAIKPLLPSPCHFTQCPTFMLSVFEVLQFDRGQPWLEEAMVFNRLGSDWDFNVSACGDAIATIADNARQFIIGITVHPRWRFFECAGGKYSKMFEKMVLIYAANTSKPWRPESTGCMEILQIARFQASHSGQCLNIAKGADKPSDGSPHFLYVCWN